MSLRDALFQSIANLDRIAPSFEQDAPAAYYSDEKIPLDQTPHASSPYACREDDKFIRLSTSTVNLSPYLRRSKSLPSIRPPTRHAEVDNSKMEAHGEPKITWRHAARIARHLLTVAFSFLSMGVAIAIIGLAADNINWGSGRGSQEANTVTAVVLGTYDADNDFLMRWVTKMSYL